MKTLLVDDHALFREGMRLLLGSLDEHAEVWQAADVPAALALLDDTAAMDLVLLDLHLPGLTGLEALHRLRAGNDTVPVVVLSGDENPRLVPEAIDAGAMGYILKSALPDEMMTALDRVLAGGIYLPPLSRGDGSRGPTTSRAPVPDTRARLRELGISPRQAEVLVKLAQGKPNKVIARELAISDTTVKSHVAAVFGALEVHNRTEAVYAVARLGLRLQDLQP